MSPNVPAAGHDSRTTLLLLVIAAIIGCQQAKSGTGQLSVADDRAIRALDSSFVTAWLRDDTAAVLATLASDVVLMPAGQYPLVGTDAIKAFWWPRDGSRTRILTFSRAIGDLHGDADIAYEHGSDTLTYTYEKGGPPSQMVSRTMHLAVLRRDADGRWRFSRIMWGNRTR